MAPLVGSHNAPGGIWAGEEWEDEMQGGGLLHQWLLGGWGVMIGEMWDLERLCEKAEELGRYTCFVSSVPLKVSLGQRMDMGVDGWLTACRFLAVWRVRLMRLLSFRSNDEGCVCGDGFHPSATTSASTSVFLILELCRSAMYTKRFDFESLFRVM